MADAIEIKKLSKIFDHYPHPPIQAVHSLDLTIQQGTVFGFLGPNGAGKTTLIKMICGLITQTEGSVHVHGYDVHKQRSDAMQQIGVVLEGARNLYWQLSAWENVLYYGRLKGKNGQQLQELAESVLHDLQLWDVRHELVGSFSRGTQQKVAIACVLIADPPIILLDEPTLGLDVHAARMVKSLILKLAHEYRKTIVLTTHQLDIVEQVCDYVALINKGQLVVHTTVHKLLEACQQEEYQITVCGSLNTQQTNLFKGMKINQEQDKTVLSGAFTHQHELYDVLAKIHAQGLSLFSASKSQQRLEEVVVQLMNQS